MTVVLDQRELATGRSTHFAMALEAAPDALEARQRRLYCGLGHTEFLRNRDRCERVEHVVATHQVQPNLEITRLDADAL